MSDPTIRQDIFKGIQGIQPGQTGPIRQAPQIGDAPPRPQPPQARAPIQQIGVGQLTPFGQAQQPRPQMQVFPAPRSVVPPRPANPFVK